jgi:hypothetical protein
MLFQNNSTASKKSQQHIRVYSMIFAFTSPSERLVNRFRERQLLEFKVKHVIQFGVCCQCNDNRQTLLSFTFTIQKMKYKIGCKVTS